MKLKPLFISLLVVSCHTATAAEKNHELTPIPLQSVTIDDPFWSPKLKTWNDVTLTDVLDKFEQAGAFRNFDRVAGSADGGHEGFPWFDGLIYETIRGASDLLVYYPNEALEKRLDDLIARIAAAQAVRTDGYIMTYTQLQEPGHEWGLNGGFLRWQHDIYNAGALVEAGVHHYKATGKTELLSVAVRMAGLMHQTIGPAPKKNLVPAHSLPETALIELYQLFNDEPDLKIMLSFPADENNFLELAEFWIENRGNHCGLPTTEQWAQNEPESQAWVREQKYGDSRPSWGAYAQDQVSVFKQHTLEGHAVRATLLASGTAAAARINRNPDYISTAERFWENMAGKRLHITGGVGAYAHEEKFGPDYVLPNDAYLETCAAIGAGFFHLNMNRLFGDARYIDEFERVLYNNIINGVSQDGRHYYYKNPLTTHEHHRWKWHECPCCPPMFLKMVSVLPEQIYACDSEGLYVNLFIGSRVICTLGGTSVQIAQQTRYPWNGAVSITLQPEKETAFPINIRIPGWARGHENPMELYTSEVSSKVQIKINGEPVKQLKMVRGYASLRRTWKKGDTIELELPMSPRRVYANPAVAADRGRVALQSGPIVYCVERDDNLDPHQIALPTQSALDLQYAPDLFGGVNVIRAGAGTTEEFTAIPFYCQDNRPGGGSIAVWLPERNSERIPVEGRILVRAGKVLNRVSPLTLGACLEDVNHEVYGGIDSQMVFGESFEEPAPAMPLEGFIYEGPRFDIRQSTVAWTVKDGILQGPQAQGAKLLARGKPLSKGAVSVKMRFKDASPGVAGLIAHVSDSGSGADNFNGYEISLNPERQQVLFGRHRHDWNMLRSVDCPVPVGEWITLEAKLDGGHVRIKVNGRECIDYIDREAPLESGMIGLRTWNCGPEFKDLEVQAAEREKTLPFAYEAGIEGDNAVSRTWTAARRGHAKGSLSIDDRDLFNGRQSQRITFTSGTGRIGVANTGLNRRGMCFREGRDYEGVIWAKAEKATELELAIESRDGARRYGVTTVSVRAGDWQRIPFALESAQEDPDGRFGIYLTKPGSVLLDYALLQPGDWGRFRGLPVRRDVAEALIAQGLTVLRYGGCMANASEYRWKKMIGPRDERPPYQGWWYPYSSNGWGIFDFMNFCEAAGFEYVPDINIAESGEDMADFIEYVKGAATTEWGAKRVADGHAAPYALKYIQIGNEETVDAHYVERFREIAGAIWARDPDIIVVVGAFAFNEYIDNTYDFGGAPRIRSLAAHEEILKFAKANDRPVWFDVHIWNDEPRDPDRIDKGMGMRSFITALEGFGTGADFKVCVFEENANNHHMRRALGHAHAINEIQRMEHEVPILCAANCLQPDRQNDNGWDQGLLFLTQSQVWGQPSYYVTQMASKAYQPLSVESWAMSDNNALDVTTLRSEDGKMLSLQVVNLDDRDVTAAIELDGFVPDGPFAEVVTLQGELDDRNSEQEPNKIVPAYSRLAIPAGSQQLKHTFPAHSYTVIELK